MKSLVPVALACALSLAVMAGDSPVRAQEPQTPASLPLSSGPGPDRFNGYWDYNDAESINVATGRPEQAPTTARRTNPTGTGRPSGGGGRGGVPSGVGQGGQAAGQRGGGPGDPTSGFGFRDFVMAESRALLRDLLEVPESFKIEVAEQAVSFTDDLGRTMTYPTDGGRLQKFQLSASVFEARAIWEGRLLRKEVEGPRGFRLRETFYLSQDGRRLFVILRVGDEKPNTRPTGANRVYDRIDQR